MSPDSPFTVYRRLLGYVAGRPGRLALVVLALGAVSASTLAIPWLAKNLFQDAIVRQDTDAFYQSLGLILAAAAVMAAGRFVAEDQIGVVSLGMLERLRNDLVSKHVRLPLAHFTRAPAGDAVSRVFNDVHVLQAFVYDAFFALGSDLLIVSGAVIALFLLSPALALMSMTAIPIAVGVVALTSRVIRRRFQRAQAALGDMTGLVVEQVGAMPAVRAFGAAEHERRRFAEAARAHVGHAVRANRVHAAARAGVNFLGVIGVVVVLAIGSTQLQEGGGLTLERLVGFALYAAVMADPLTRLSRTNFEIQKALAAGRRVFETLDLPEERQGGTAVLPAHVRGELRFESVAFAYRPDEPVLHDVTLTIHAGETVAVVGASGAGKSTLTQLALRFHEPAGGRVLLDGIDIREPAAADLRSRIGWAGQDPFLFGASVADNIRYGTWSASREEIEAAARLARADQFIRDLPMGYETRIGERGADLSGGQRARLAMARVILRSPPVVILDECTASLDTETEARLWKDLDEWLRGRTVLIIAHRLSTVLNRPRLVVLEAGRVVGDGSADELQRTCPAFTRLFEEQMNLAPGAEPGPA